MEISRAEWREISPEIEGPMTGMDRRNRAIRLLRERGHTDTEIGGAFDLSRERIRQLRKQAGIP